MHCTLERAKQIKARFGIKIICRQKQSVPRHLRETCTRKVRENTTPTGGKRYAPLNDVVGACVSIRKPLDKFYELQCNFDKNKLYYFGNWETSMKNVYIWQEF